MSKNSDGSTAESIPTVVNQNNPANSQETITAADFVQLIRSGETRNWNGCQISGDVILRGQSFAKPFAIQGAVFLGTLDLSQARFKRGANFPGCRFRKLILSDARVEGPLILDNVVIGEQDKPTRDVDMLRSIAVRLYEGCRKARKRRNETDNEDSRAREAGIFWRRRKTRQKVRSLVTNVEPQTVAEIDNLHIAGCLSLMKARVFGSVSCNHAEIEDDFRIDGTQIYGALSLRHTTLSEFRTDALKPGASTSQCLIQGDLDLTSATIKGDLRLIAITIGGQLTVQAANITGNLLCRSSNRGRTRLRKGAWLMVVRIDGVTDFGGSQIRGDLQIQNGRLGGNLACGKSGVWFCVVKGDVNLIGCRCNSDVSFTGANLQGSLLLQNGMLGGALFLNCTPDLKKNARCRIAKKAWLLGISVASDIDISGARIGGDLILQNANIGQNFTSKIMGGFQTEICGETHLNGARIRGGVEFGGSILRGELDLDGATIDGGFLARLDFDETRNLEVHNTRVAGRIRARSAVINRPVLLMGLTVGPPENPGIELPVSERGIDFTGAQISGEFSLNTAKLVGEVLESRRGNIWAKEISKEIEQAASRKALRLSTTIEGGLWLTRAQVNGDITLCGAKISGELDLRDAELRANINCWPIEHPDTSADRATVHRADFETLNMSGDMKLTGLDIVGKPPDGTNGDLILRDSRIRGRLELCPSNHSERKSDDSVFIANSASIRGDLRLDAAEISHLIVSGKNFFKKPGSPEAHNARIVLERATVGRMEIVEPLPGALDLSNLRVDRLDRLEQQSIYEKMLKQSFPFKKSNYLMVEHILRNAGLDTEADKVHVLMRRRDRSNMKSSGRWLFDKFLDLSIEYGTTSKRLGYLMLVWFLISVLIFNNSSHVEYQIAPVLQQFLPLEWQHPSNWSTWHAVLYAAHLHVPIISLGVAEEVEPSGLLLRAYAMTVVAASWVMWPLLIASASGFIRKRD